MTLEERKRQYEDYLYQHISGVKKSYKEIIKPWMLSEGKSIIETYLTEKDIKDLDTQIEYHDESKWDPQEYIPYLNHFYPEDGSGEIEDTAEFNQAWLHHIHNNPHHWQYWILINDTDEEKMEILEMDMKFIIEMLCDWSSFQYYRPGSTANQWYKDNGDRMILNDKTRKVIETILESIPEL